MVDSYNLIKQAMSVSNLRSSLISSNIANINTSGYKAQRVEFEDKLAQAMGNDGLALTETHHDHMALGGDIQPQVVHSNTSVKKNGNNVDLEVEETNQAVNSLYYSALTAQLNGRYQMLSYVLDH